MGTNILSWKLHGDSPKAAFAAISHRTCKKIYDLIKDIDFGNRCFRYAIHAHNDWEEFKDFLMDCYSHHKKMKWS